MNVYRIFTDGGSRGNPGKAASGFVLKDSTGIVREKRGKYLGVQTNNYAEYYAVVLALETVKEIISASEKVYLSFFMDSQLAVRQLMGEYKVKSPSIATFISRIRELEKRYQGVEYNHIPREQNKEADRLVNEILNKEGRL